MKKLPHQKDAYLRRLMIADHIREVNWLYDLYKGKQRAWEIIQKELADLLILIQDEVDVELIKERFEKFKEKSEE